MTLLLSCDRPHRHAPLTLSRPLLRTNSVTLDAAIKPERKVRAPSAPPPPRYFSEELSTRYEPTAAAVSLESGIGTDAIRIEISPRSRRGMPLALYVKILSRRDSAACSCQSISWELISPFPTTFFLLRHLIYRGASCVAHASVALRVSNESNALTRRECSKCVMFESFCVTSLRSLILSPLGVRAHRQSPFSQMSVNGLQKAPSNRSTGEKLQCIFVDCSGRSFTR